MLDIKSLVKPYSPWLEESERRIWETNLPNFHRPVFEKLLDDLESIDQMISITGPRRVGKSTLLNQIAHHLLQNRSIAPERIIFYDFGDPSQFRRSITSEDIVESLMEQMLELGRTGPSYLFLDEIQKLERWELYLKKYYDLKYPIKIIVSGSASSPIFKKSRESLMGRIKDYHVLPFSFREFLLFRLQEDEDEENLKEVISIFDSGAELMGMFAKDPAYLSTESVSLPQLSDSLWDTASKVFQEYLINGGFPEVWRFETLDKKIEYLFDNQVRKVIDEDLVLATEFRKPEQLKIFYISLLERPGREVSRTSLSHETGIKAQQIDKYLPLLEMTDLIRHADKFRKSSVWVRRGNQKFYPVDLSLRNAVLRIGNELLDDQDTLGLYAENLVFNALHKWTGVLKIDFFRENQKEVDFIVHLRPNLYFPVEVKYRSRWKRQSLQSLSFFTERYHCVSPVVVTKNKEDFGRDGEYFCIPLLLFLLMFD